MADLNKDEKIETGKYKNTEEEVIEAIEGSNCFKSLIAQKLNCSVKTVNNWLNRSEKVREAYDAEKERACDLVEDYVMKAIAKGNTTAMFKYLNAHARDRGYGQTVELTGKNGSSILPANIIVQDQATADAYKAIVNHEGNA